MTKLNYSIKMTFPEEVYFKLFGLLALKCVKSEADWGESGLRYQGRIYYFDDSNTNAARISSKRLLGLLERKIELTDKVEQEIVDEVKNIINIKNEKK